MTTGGRCLVLGTDPADIVAGLVVLACAESTQPVPYDRARHTYLTKLATCAACLVVHAAWYAVVSAEAETR